jgi:3-oxoacyl-[acyl-carrier protein] reductase
MNDLWPAQPLSGRVALITGCGRPNGIGAAIARTMAAAGALVVVTDVDPAGARGAFLETFRVEHEQHGLTALVDEIKAAGGQADMAVGDVSSEADAARLVGHAEHHHGHLDILVNNAAAPHGAEMDEIERIAVEDWDRVMGVNARGPFLMSRAAAPGMRSRRWGRIINMSSVAAVRGHKEYLVYCASKAAVLGFTRSLALSLAPFGITVNAINPHSINTSRMQGQARRLGATDVEQSLAERGRSMPVGRMGRPQDIAGLATYLATEMASFITARDISVDGGDAPG